jgi:hypothetical protein
LRLPFWNGKGPGKAMTLQFINFMMVTHSLHRHLQALDSFVYPILGFKDDSPISVVPISVRTLSAESVSESSMGTNVRSSRARAGKCKAAATLSPLKIFKRS